ncbi:MAG: hypothetical protein IT350_05455 [Deltaproteobacteria bacterium]|nr:hypothetical protein [Deltaproteobacteria bacterium]
MEDRKNVPFVSGLALILSALALLLIGISQINPSPYDETMEEVVDKRFSDMESRVNLMIEARLQQLAKAEENAAIRELKTFQAQLQDWVVSSQANGYSEKVKAIAAQIDMLVADMEGKKVEAPAPAAPAAPTAPAPPAEAPTAN